MGAAALQSNVALWQRDDVLGQLQKLDPSDRSLRRIAQALRGNDGLSGSYILFEDETELQNGVAILASEMGCSNKMKCRLLDEISAVRKAVADEPERQARRFAAAKRRVARMKQRAAAEQRQQ